MTRQVSVRVPASTSNLGAGFDCVGVAVDRWLTVEASVEPDAGSAPRVIRHGTLATLNAAPDRDRIVIAFRAACEAAGRAVPDGLVFQATSEIPVARGLGSSAAASVAGAAAANSLLRLGYDDQQLIDLCAALEGHPDNVVPAVRGGAALAVAAVADDGSDDRTFVSSSIELHPDVALAFAVPDFEVETAYMRAALPASVPHAVAARAAALGAALVSGLTTGHPGLLELALDDVLHVPFRRELVPGYREVTSAARRAGAYGATLSGSGSSLCAIAPKPAVRDVAAAMADAWRSLGITAEAIACEEGAAGYSVVRRGEEKLGGTTGAVETTTLPQRG